MRARALIATLIAGMLGACSSASSHDATSKSNATITINRPTTATTSAASSSSALSTISTTSQRSTAPTSRASTTTERPPASTAVNTSRPTIGGASGGPVHGTLRGKVITIDPGHNGGNSQHTTEINKLVDIGTGWKACNTVGTATNDGYPEHAFTWDVSMRVVSKLRARGARVILTHPNDTGWGPCSVDRAAIANRAGSTAAVSIHADGGPASGRGFFVIQPKLLTGLTDDIYSSSQRLATGLRDTVKTQTAMPTSSYAGSGGILVAGTYGGLNRADVPAVFIECGNMRNATDAALLKNAAFREQLASAIARGIENFARGA